MKNLADEMQRTARQALAGMQPVALGDEPGGLPFGRLLAAVFRARYLLFGTTLFGVLVGTFLAITTPNSYVSTGKFLFTSTGAEAAMLDPTRARETSQETIATGAAYILSTDEPLRRVVKEVGPGRILQPYSPGTGAESGVKGLFYKVQREWNDTPESERTEEGALRRLQRTVTVERPQYTDVLIAKCTANDPGLAQQILATFMAKAREFHIEKYDDQKTYDQAQKQFEDGKTKFEQADTAYREFLARKAQVADFDQEKKRLALDCDETATRVATYEEDLHIQQRTLQQLTEQLEGPKALKQTLTRDVREGLNSGLIRELEAQRAKAELELVQIQASRSATDPDAVRKQREIDLISGRIKVAREEARDAPIVQETVDNPQYVAAFDNRLKIQGELTILAAKLEEAKRLHGEKTKQLKALVDLEPEHETLRRELTNARTSRDNATSIWDLAQRKRALGMGKFSSLQEIEPASFALEKEGPNRGKLLIGGLLVGLFLGLGIVVLRTLPDKVVRTRDDLEDIEGLAVIGVMPRIDNTNLRRHTALRDQGW
ncbi:MAG: hypothetical protein JNN13_00365 [Planctomycetes bacterium]|nr:hypothetical protein [Planctomycetota bacterium]